MRTPLTSDDDVVAKLNTEACRAARTFRAIVNETLRRGMGRRRAVAQQQCFKVAARDLGDLKPRLSLDHRRSGRGAWGRRVSQSGATGTS